MKQLPHIATLIPKKATIFAHCYIQITLANHDLTGMASVCNSKRVGGAHGGTHNSPYPQSTRLDTEAQKITYREGLVTNFFRTRYTNTLLKIDFMEFIGFTASLRKP
ncbi:MAG: hypothetical protein O7D30_09810 [Rickettsia endosymbiont of Ixodes persulcatus]|nr:hypothetical protein [Rickettsia endosymbiont of Ixodes persulcatus]